MNTDEQLNKGFETTSTPDWRHWRPCSGGVSVGNLSSGRAGQTPKTSNTGGPQAPQAPLLRQDLVGNAA